MRIALSQINPTIGDLRGNLALIQQEIIYAAQEQANVVVFPELATVGYPPRDLLYDEFLWESHDKAVAKIQQYIRSLNKPITAIVGGLHQVKLCHGRCARYNAAFIIDVNEIRIVHKRLLPCYDVFDETRYFTSATDEPYVPITIDGIAFDVLICEDIWNYGLQTRASWMSPASYNVDPVHNLRGDGPIIVLNASPYWDGKIQTTRELLTRIANNTNRLVLWCNQVGGHDDIVFGGYSMVATPEIGSELFNPRYKSYLGHLAMAPPFDTGCIFATLGDKRVNNRVSVLGVLGMNINGGQHNPVIRLGPVDHADVDEPIQKHLDIEDLETYFLFCALRLGLKDYCRRNGFEKVVFGASGGIDSAVVGAIAAITLGGENCTAITLPSRYSSHGSVQDSADLASNCCMVFKNQTIAPTHRAIRDSILTGGRQKFARPVTDENIQPRIRAILLMAESNDTGALLLTTGNKSELAVGYCTIYGDMCGGYSLLSDVPKTWVYKLAKFINKYWPSRYSHSGNGIIPETTISKPPSAELAPDQQDTDTLPPYNELDPIIDQIMRHVPMEQIKASTSLRDQEVDRIFRMINIAEYKRSQAPIGPKVTERAFGSGRRIPIAKKVTYV